MYLAVFLLTAAFCVPAMAKGPACAGDMHGLILRLGQKDGQASAIAELKACGQPAMAALERAMRRGTVAQRRGGAVGLALLPMPGLASDCLLGGLDDEDSAVRSLAAHGLARIGGPVARDVAALLASDRERVRNAAAHGLSLMGKDAVPALCTVLESDDPFVQAKAAWLLGRMGRGGLSAVPALVHALGAADPRAVHVVAEAIDLIGPDPRVLAFHYTLLDAGPTLTGRLGTGAAPVMIRLLTRPGTLTGQVAFRALAGMGAAAQPALEATLESGAPGQRVAAALLLVKLDPNLAPGLPEDVRAILVESGRLQQ
jgi:hypothetical protein